MSCRLFFRASAGSGRRTNGSRGVRAGAWRDHPAAGRRLGAGKLFCRNRRGATRARRAPALFHPLGHGMVLCRDRAAAGLIPATLAELRQFRREGALVDALSQDGFPLAIMDAIRQETTIPLEGGEIRCRKTPHLRSGRATRAFRRPPHWSRAVEQLDFFRRLRDAQALPAAPARPAPRDRDVALSGRARGVCQHARPSGVSGARPRRQGRAEEHALGVLFGFVRNQGDGWTQALDYLTRYLDDALLSGGTRPADLPDPDVFFLSLARQLGIRTAEMHRALGRARRR